MGGTLSFNATHPYQNQDPTSNVYVPSDYRGPMVLFDCASIGSESRIFSSVGGIAIGPQNEPSRTVRRMFRRIARRGIPIVYTAYDHNTAFYVDVVLRRMPRGAFFGAASNPGGGRMFLATDVGFPGCSCGLHRFGVERKLRCISGLSPAIHKEVRAIVTQPRATRRRRSVFAIHGCGREYITRRSFCRSTEPDPHFRWIDRQVDGATCRDRGSSGGMVIVRTCRNQEILSGMNRPESAKNPFGWNRDTIE